MTANQRPLPTGLREHCFESNASQVAALAARVVAQLQAGLDERGHATLAVSGGRSPIALFHALREAPLDWSRITLTLVDERCVPESHADSNARLVREHLWVGPAKAARFVSWLPGVVNPDAQAPEALATSANRHNGGVPKPWDVAVLGMGDDGHTASLFAGAPGYARAIASDDRLAWVVPEQAPVPAPHARLTFTLHALLEARELVLSIAGDNKLAVYHQAAAKADPALPVSLVLNQTRTPVSVWIG
jgi:6-phosphogluconolactonase